MEDNNFQRLGSTSNARAGADFENDIRLYFRKTGIELIPNFGIEVGHNRRKKTSKI